MNVRSLLALSTLACAAVQAIACGGSTNTDVATSDGGAGHTTGSGGSSSGAGGSGGTTGVSGSTGTGGVTGSGGTTGVGGSTGTGGVAGTGGTGVIIDPPGDPCNGVPCGTVCGRNKNGTLYCDMLGKCGEDPPSRGCDTGMPDA